MISPQCFTSLNESAQLKNIYEAILASSGIVIPQYDYMEISYVGSTNNIDTVVYKTGGSGGTAVSTLTMTYVGGVPAANDALLESVTQS